MSLGADQQHRTRSLSNDRLRDASGDEMRDASATMRAHDDEVVPIGGGRAKDRLRRLAKLEPAAQRGREPAGMACDQLDQLLAAVGVAERVRGLGLPSSEPVRGGLITIEHVHEVEIGAQPIGQIESVLYAGSRALREVSGSKYATDRDHD